jgi:hypothetical protein
MILRNKAHPTITWLGLEPEETDFLVGMNKL